jgi:hypothetical protein
MQAQQAARMVGQASTYQWLAVHGRWTTASLLGLRDTGRALDGDPELELELLVDLEGERAVLFHRQVVSRLAARELRLGSSLAVRVDPSDPTTLLLA